MADPNDRDTLEEDSNGTGDDQQHEAGERQLSPREEALRRVEDQLELQRGQEIDGYSPEIVEDAAPPAKAAAVVPEQDQPKTIKVKVDGEEREVPIDEVVSSYQKQAYANKVMGEAAKRLKEVEEREAQLKLQQESGDDTHDDEGDDDLTSTAQKIIDGLIEGDVESATAVLAEALRRGKEPKAETVDPAKFREVAKEILAEEELEADYNKARDMFQRDYKVVNDDPNLAAICNIRYQQEIEKGLKPTEAAKIAGDATLEWLERTTGRKDQGISRQELKRKLTTITPTSVGSSGVGDTGAQSPRDVVAEMKKTRGQG